MGIATRYLQGKYTACDLEGGNCRAVCDRAEITAVLKEILPPVSAKELETEVFSLRCDASFIQHIEQILESSRRYQIAK